MIFCLSGAHRVGKTTLMRAACEVIGSRPIEMNIGKIQKEFGYDSSNQSYDLDTRLTIQEKVIKRVEEMFQSISASDDVLFDRSPLDVAAYTLIHANEAMTEHQSARMNKVLHHAIEISQKYVLGCLLVQPGIPLRVENSTSAACAEGFIEKLNAVCFGLMNHDLLTDVPMYFIPRNICKIEDRVKVAKSAVQRAMARNAEKGRLDQLRSNLSQEISGFYEINDKKH